MKDYHKTVIKIHQGVTRFFKTAFSAINLNHPEFDASPFSNGGMIVCSHRSHLDYFAAGWLLHKIGVLDMRFAAGNNLTTLPYIGKRFLSYGAFAVDRSAASKRSYIRALFEQVVTMLSTNDNILVFPEGGRSYKGNMMEIRGGIIGAGIVAQLRNPQKRTPYLPMSISYECMPEVQWLEMLEKGKHIRKTAKNPIMKFYGDILYFGADAIAFGRLVIGNKFRMVNQGAIYIDIGKPFYIDEIVNLKTDCDPDARDDFSGCRVAVQKLSLVIHEKFLQLYCLLPQHLVAALCVSSVRLAESEAVARLPELVEKCRTRGLNVRIVASMSPKQLFHDGAKQLKKLRGVDITSEGLRVLKPTTISYCAASIDFLDK